MCDNTLYEPADIIIYVQGEGIVVKEKSFLAYRKRDNKIVAIGTEAGTAERVRGCDGDFSISTGDDSGLYRC